jgi:hypothetical protein
MKKAALVLSGALRHTKNIKQIKNFIETHKNYKFYLFIHMILLDLQKNLIIRILKNQKK